MTAESTFAHDYGRDARILMRRARWASLATFDRQTGYPYVSLIAVATDVAGHPLFLISTLARHTQNLEFDARASILFSSAGATADPLDAGRVSVMGRAAVNTDETARWRFLARHDETSEYAGFSDFALWSLTPELGHYVGGFGRIHALSAAQLQLEGDDTAAFAAGQIQSLAELNARPGLIERLAVARFGASAGPWTLSGADPEGCDLTLRGEALRLDFSNRLQNFTELGAMLEQLAVEI
jgi:putative heme iron utilization protein